MLFGRRTPTDVSLLSVTFEEVKGQTVAAKFATTAYAVRSYGRDNGVKVFCQEAGTAHQAAIDVFNRENLASVHRL